MIKLETTNGQALSKILREVSPISYSSNRQVNRLLDGTYHVQVIGNPLKSMTGNIISSYEQAEILNSLIDQGVPLVLIFLDKKYLIYIDEAIKWTRINFAHGHKDKSYFKGDVLMIIKEEMSV